MLSAKELCKSFGSQQVLKGISFDIPEACIFGLLGPNGSGKTTTVRLLNGLLSMDSGSASIGGISVGPHQPELRHLCGVMTEGANLYDELSGRYNLEFFAGMFSIKEARKRCDELLAFFELEHAADRLVRTYSTGMRKRLMLARALLHKPRMLFLDEPTSGLDPESALEVNNLIRQLANEDRVTILLCTHQLKYAEGLCTSYGFLDEGVMRASGSWEELLLRAGQPRFLELRGEALQHPQLERTVDGRWRVPIADDEAAAEAVQTLTTNGGRVYEAKQTTLSLEDLYFDIIAKSRGGV